MPEVYFHVLEGLWVGTEREQAYENVREKIHLFKVSDWLKKEHLFCSITPLICIKERVLSVKQRYQNKW